MIIIEPDVFKDKRGFFLETYQYEKYKKGGVTNRFIQDNFSRSVRGTLRGLHFQMKKPQGKLIRVVRGEIFDVGVDIRKGSPTFGKWTGLIVSSENFKQIYVPPGFAHGFCVISDFAEVEYKCTDFYDPSDEYTLVWNDPEIGVDWPIKNPILSVKDMAAQPLSAITLKLPA